MGRHWETTEGWLPYQEVLREHGLGVSEEEDFFPDLPPAEWELQSLWYAGVFGREFLTVDGAPVTIVDFGDWNQGAGPDFLRCAVQIDGAKVTGDIELDGEARDWERHGHGDSDSFRDVILHLCFRDTGPKWFTRTKEYREVPRVVLSWPPKGVGNAASSQRVLARAGLCSGSLEEMKSEHVDGLLRVAASWRWRRKTARYRQWVAVQGGAQALWQAIAEALGYSRNGKTMLALAQKYPLRQARLDGPEAESRMLGMAGFLEEARFDSLPPDSRSYVRGLWESWWKYRVAPDKPALPWVRSGLRPANHPQRRVATMALLAGKWPTISRLAANPVAWKRLVKWLSAVSHPYWDAHYTLASRPSAKPVAMVGEARALDLLVNVCFPFAALHRSQEELWPVFREIPSLMDNEKIKRAVARILGKRQDIKERTKGAWRQQGLLQLYDDFCLKDRSGCDECLFPNQVVEREWE